MLLHEIRDLIRSFTPSSCILWSLLIEYGYCAIAFHMLAVAVFAAVSCVLIVAALHTGQIGIFPLQLLALGYFGLGLVAAQMLRVNGIKEWEAFLAILHNGRGGR